ncbi:shikimate kinase [Candidatus Shikimatogenerans bostrichidophilus]|uniref:shikimate kinase n=1 Tax=Candidatus Shikimatogenerans bostrichidophilus TaxID=2943807 RepID=UPI0029666F55
MKIILIGYMGSGKTYIGQLLSLITKYLFYDLDKLISIKYKMSINKIYKIYGDNKLRIFEKINLKKILFNNYLNYYILSVGGGTPCNYNNIKLMNKFIITIYLKTYEIILYKRLLKDNKKRPIIYYLPKKKLFNFIKKHIKIRKNNYFKSKYIINTNYMNFIDIANYIKYAV